MKFLVLLAIVGLAHSAAVEKKAVGMPDCDVIVQEASLLKQIISLNHIFVESTDNDALKTFIISRTEELKSAVNSALLDNDLKILKFLPEGMGDGNADADGIFACPGCNGLNFLKYLAKQDLANAHGSIENFLKHLGSMPSDGVKGVVLHILKDAMNVCSKIANTCQNA